MIALFRTDAVQCNVMNDILNFQSILFDSIVIEIAYT